MHDAAVSQQFAEIWEDAFEDAGRSDKPLLAHYTSIQVLEQIIRADEIWFSNPLMMNDHEEVRFGILQGVPLVLNSAEIAAACGSQQRADAFRHAFGGYYNAFVNEEAVDTYVFSLSEHPEDNHDGVLSMWRAYGGNGNGVAIVLDSAKLQFAPESALILAKVSYASTAQRIDRLEQSVAKFANILARAQIADERLDSAAAELFERIKMFALFTKHHGFKEENEWRVAYVRTRDTQGRLEQMFSYSIGPRGVEPRLRFDVAPREGADSANLSFEGIVDRIILGPSASSPLAKAAVLRMLEQSCKSALRERIYVSSIPFRPA